MCRAPGSAARVRYKSIPRLPQSTLVDMSITEQQKQQRRGYLRRQLMSGTSSHASLCTMWPEFLDLHISAARPGRAVALLDVQYMVENRRIRVTSGNADSGAAAASSSDGPRELHEAEVASITAWLDAYRAAVPAASADLRATEELRQGGHSGRGVAGNRKNFWSDFRPRDPCASYGCNASGGRGRGVCGPCSLPWSLTHGGRPRPVRMRHYAPYCARFTAPRADRSPEVLVTTRPP
jgi:hypothetical protein